MKFFSSKITNFFDSFQVNALSAPATFS